jgi:hypothetical protein
MWRREWKAHCGVRRKYRLAVPTFEEFVQQVHGDVDITNRANDQKPDPVLEHIKSHRSKYRSAQGESYVAPDRSVMDQRSLDNEPKHIREQIIAKSKRIAPAFSKGADQYITDGSDKKELGRKL